MILITGGAGFIGSHVSDIFINNGYDVIIVDNLVTGNIDNINKKAIFYNIDIKDFSGIEKVFKKYNVDYVIHLAAQVSVPNSIRDPLYDANENIIGTINILELSKKYNIKKIIASSSAAVYKSSENPIKETDELNVLSFYGLSKLTMEKYIELYNVDYIICRFSNVYGPRQTVHGESGVISIFVNNIINNKEITIFGNGEQTRDFIYVKDIANIFYKLKLKDISKIILNISTNQSITINNLFNLIKKYSNKEVNCNYADERFGDIKHSILDNTKLLNLININITDIDAGLKATINFFNNN